MSASALTESSYSKINSVLLLNDIVGFLGCQTPKRQGKRIYGAGLLQPWWHTSGDVFLRTPVCISVPPDFLSLLFAFVYIEAIYLHQCWLVAYCPPLREDTGVGSRFSRCKCAAKICCSFGDEELQFSSIVTSKGLVCLSSGILEHVLLMY